MKFAEHLTTHITPEWRKQYIQYDEMKGILYKQYKSFQQCESVTSRITFVRNFDDKFLGFCKEELDKVSSFYLEKASNYKRILLALKTELPKFRLRASGSTDFGYQFLHMHRKEYKKKHDLEMAFSELYLGFVLLQNFQALNHNGFRKILKKHDKLYLTDQGRLWFNDNVKDSPFVTDESLDNHIKEIEDIVTEAFQRHDRAKAMKKLRVPPLDDHRTLAFDLGLFTGAFLFSMFQIPYALYNALSSQFYDSYTIIRLYRAYLLINLYIFVLGFNVYGWRRSGVNHILIFELDPRSHLEAQNLLTISAFLSCMTSLNLIGFLEAKHLGVPPYFFPLLHLLSNVVFLLNPFKCLWHEARCWLLKHIGRIFSSGFHKVTFADFWLTDQMLSLTPVLLDIEYTICTYIYSTGGTSWTHWWSLSEATTTTSKYYHDYCSSKLSITRMLLRLLPALLRFIQCIRRYYDRGNPKDHLVNAGKYFMGILSITSSSILAYTEYYIYPGDLRYSNPSFYIWILLSIGTTFFAYYWDVRRDWGLFDPKAEVKFLREELVYSSKCHYYFAMGLNLILRFSWAVSLSITENKYVTGDIMTTITAPLEILRRFIWNFFRLENEHLNNVGDFRALRDIAILPLERSTVMGNGDMTENEDDEAVIQITKIRHNVSKSSPVRQGSTDSVSQLLQNIAKTSIHGQELGEV